MFNSEIFHIITKSKRVFSVTTVFHGRETETTTDRDTSSGRQSVRSRQYIDSRSVHGTRWHTAADSRHCCLSIRRSLYDHNHTSTWPRVDYARAACELSEKISQGRGREGGEGRGEVGWGGGRLSQNEGEVWKGIPTLHREFSMKVAFLVTFLKIIDIASNKRAMSAPAGEGGVKIR